MKFFNKKKQTSESEASSTTTSNSTQPPSYSADPTALKYDPLSEGVKLTLRSENRDLENAESDKKKGRLPAYETEQDHYLGKLMDNYGSGGLGGGFGAPKLPNIPPRQKKPKKKWGCVMKMRMCTEQEFIWAHTPELARNTVLSEQDLYILSRLFGKG